MRHQPNARAIGSSLAQIALTFTLLIAAALVLKSFSRLQSLSLGYEPRHADRASGNAMADLQHSRQDRHVRQDVARQSASASRCAKRGDKLERAAHGWMANWILARRHAATDGRGNVERRSRSRRGRLFFDIQSAITARPNIERARHERFAAGHRCRSSDGGQIFSGRGPDRKTPDGRCRQ